MKQKHADFHVGLEFLGNAGFPHEVVTRMMTARYDTLVPRYPHAGVLRFDRRRYAGSCSRCQGIA
jgi:hypothetical protein